MVRTRLTAMTVAGLLTLALAACSQDGTDPEPTSDPTTADAPTEAPTTEAPEPTEASSDTSLPSRADMEDWERILAEGVFIDLVRDFGGFDAYEDAALIQAGDAACDAMDRGDSFQSVLIVAAGLLPAADSTDAIAALAGSATGTLCPEHQDYLD